jgi:hypothetical protein
VTATAWSNTLTNGTLGNAGADCNQWTGSGSSAWGRTNMVDGTWTSWCTGGACDGLWVTTVYCFQQ